MHTPHKPGAGAVRKKAHLATRVPARESARQRVSRRARHKLAQLRVIGVIARDEAVAAPCRAFEQRAQAEHVRFGNALIGVKNENPVTGAAVQGGIARGGEIIAPRKVGRHTAEVPRDIKGLVGGPGIDNADFVGEARGTVEAFRQVVRFIAHDHGDGKRRGHGHSFASGGFSSSGSTRSSGCSGARARGSTAPAATRAS